jgi:hypothetical protein
MVTNPLFVMRGRILTVVPTSMKLIVATEPWSVFCAGGTESNG